MDETVAFLAVLAFLYSVTGGGIISITVVCTIVLSIVVHGLSDNPQAAQMAGRLKTSNE